jgi:hypothetical protein
MGFLREVLVFLHLIGFALLLGGATAQYLSGRLRINMLMLVGAATQVVTGVALAGVPDENGQRPDPAPIAVKLIVALCVLAMTFFARKREKVNRGHFLAVVALVLGNGAIGVFWI